LKQIVLIITIAILFCNLLNAQNTIIHSGLDGNSKTKATVKKQTKNNTSSKNNESSSQEIDPWMISFSVAHLSRSMLVLGVEHCFANRLGIGADMGYCFYLDKMNRLFNKSDAFDGFVNSTKDYSYFNTRNYYASVTAKYYTKYYESPINGDDLKYYLGAQIRNYQQNLVLKPDFHSPNNKTYSPITNIGMYVQVGVVTNHVSTANSEVYIGLGTLNTSYENYTFNSNSNTYDYVNQNNSSKFSILFGVKRGVTFRRKK
jgi:hypothetical protein